MTDIGELDDRARKERSPSFPFIPLERAVERARAVLDAHKRSPARLTTVAETWGYAPASSGLQQTAAALKAFGLLEDIGRGEERKIQLTELASRILLDTRPGAREQALKEAAKRPRLIAEYLDRWLPERPSDNHCVSELHLDRGFTEGAAKLFLRVFDETVTYAHLSADDGLSDPAAAREESDQFPTNGTASAAVQRVTHALLEGRARLVEPVQPSARYAQSVPRATLPLPEGEVALEIPPALSARSYAKLKAWVVVMLQMAEPEEESTEKAGEE